MEVVPLTPTIHMLRFPVVQAYAVRLSAGWAIVDTGPPGAEGEILHAVDGLAPRLVLRQIVLTHSHRDHSGSAAALAAETGALVLAGAGDAAVIAGDIPEPDPVITDAERPFYEQIAGTIPEAPSVPVDRALRGGDDLGWDEASRVVEVPGHTAGSIAVHLPESRVLFTGDNIAWFDGAPILGPFNVSRRDAKASFRRLSELDVDIACFGHGDPIVGDAGTALRAAATHVGE